MTDLNKTFLPARLQDSAGASQADRVAFDLIPDIGDPNLKLSLPEGMKAWVIVCVPGTGFKLQEYTPHTIAHKVEAVIVDSGRDGKIGPDDQAYRIPSGDNLMLTFKDGKFTSTRGGEWALNWIGGGISLVKHHRSLPYGQMSVATLQNKFQDFFHLDWEKILRR